MKTGYNKYRKGDTFDGRKIIFPFSMVGVSVLIQFKELSSLSLTFEYKTSDGTITTLNALSGEIFLTPRKMDYPASTYTYDVQLTFPNGKTKTYLQDKLILFTDVSR
jgi:hypothetical protein